MSRPNFIPWQVHPGLTEERLMVVAEIVRRARHEAVNRHEPSMGDDPWVLGCRAYKWQCFGLARASEDHPEWLAIAEGGGKVEDDEGGEEAFLSGHRFVFTVGGVPLRFYKGVADEVPPRSLRRHYPEIAAHQTAFEFVAEPAPDMIYRIAVETDEVGEAKKVILVEVSEVEGEPLRHYEIPAMSDAGMIAQFRAREEETELDEPQVGPRKDEEAEEDGDDS